MNVYTDAANAVYDEKVNSILRELAAGKSREKLAQEMGYTTYKSIDMYLRRKNFKWDARLQNYVPNAQPERRPICFEASPLSTKMYTILSYFEKNGSNADPRAIARLAGFKDHLEMAAYMRSKNYRWDTEKFNYIPDVKDKKNKANEDIVEIGKQNSQCESAYPSGDTEQETYTEGSGNIGRFIPLLELIEQHKEKILSIIQPESDPAAMPRYIIPGVFITKSIHMSNNLDRLVREFSADKNISQRDIFEVALINFFRQYGYKREIEALLGNR